MKPTSASRREFLHQSAAAIGGIAAGSLLAPARAPAAGANKKLVAGIMGCGGRQLAFDGKTETFVNDTEANKYLKRIPRKPWAIPDEV